MSQFGYAIRLIWPGKSGRITLEVRTLIEGGCRNPALSRCVFICDECIAFSTQVIADRDTTVKEAHR